MSHNRNKKETYNPISAGAYRDDRFDDIEGTHQDFPTYGNDRKQIEREDAFSRPDFITPISEQTGRKIGKHVLGAHYSAEEIASHNAILGEQKQE